MAVDVPTFVTIGLTGTAELGSENRATMETAAAPRRILDIQGLVMNWAQERGDRR
jgi:hypothetical protein